MTLAFIPSPTISYIKIGAFTIHFYALTMLAGIIAAVAILTHRWKKLGGTFEQVLDVTLVTVPCGLVGARIFHCVTVPYAYFPPTGNILNIFKVWEGGMAIFGALIGGALGAWLWSRHRKYSLLLLADALAPGLLVAQAIGRIGNWFNQELYGGPTTLPWGLKLNGANAIGKYELCYTGQPCPNPNTTLFQPAFLYEMIWDLAGACLLVWFGNKFFWKLRGGQLFAMYLMWYGTGRACIEAMRINLSSEILGIRINVWVAAFGVLLGIILYLALGQHGPTHEALMKQLQIVTEADKAAEEAEQKAHRAKESSDASSDR